MPGVDARVLPGRSRRKDTMKSHDRTTRFHGAREPAVGLTRAGNTGHTRGMKTAVSLPDDLFRLVDARARALKISRSALLAKAAREFLEKGTPAADSTAAWNAAIEKGGQPGDEPAALAFRRRAKRVLGTGRAKKR